MRNTIRKILLNKRHLTGSSHINPRILISEDGRWISNGHWLVNTSILDMPEFVEGEKMLQCWVAGRMFTKPLHEVHFPTLTGKTVKELFPKGKLFKIQRTNLLVKNGKVTYPLLMGPNALPMLIDPVYDELFHRSCWWGSDSGISNQSDIRQYMGAVCNHSDIREATVILMPTKTTDMGLEILGLSIGVPSGQR